MIENEPFTHTYFETKPQGGFLGEKSYVESARIMGRSCLDVACTMNKKLVLVNRTSEPIIGPWLVGGRIRWEIFSNPYQYAALTAREHLGVDIAHERMHILRPRFLCLKKRPYPEVLIWVSVEIHPEIFQNFNIDMGEQDRAIIFPSKEKLELYNTETKVDKIQNKMLLDLWDELSDLGILE